MGKKKEPEVKQPGIEGQRMYASVRDNDATLVHIRKKTYKMHWLKKGQIAKLSRLLIGKKKFDDVTDDATKDDNALTNEEKLSSLLEDQKLSCKAAAIFLLDGWLKLKLWYCFLWRWFYYVKQYDDYDLEEVLSEGKKKVPLDQFLKSTIYLIGVKDTLMMMRAAEAEHILHELSTGQLTASPKESGD